MNENELLETFLGAFPESEHPCDRKRFVAYCLASARNRSAFREDAFRERRLSEERINHLETVHSWIRDAYDYLHEKGLLVDGDF